MALAWCLSWQRASVREPLPVKGMCSISMTAATLASHWGLPKKPSHRLTTTSTFRLLEAAQKVNMLLCRGMMVASTPALTRVSQTTSATLATESSETFSGR